MAVRAATTLFSLLFAALPHEGHAFGAKPIVHSSCLSACSRKLSPALRPSVQMQHRAMQRAGCLTCSAAGSISGHTSVNAATYRPLSPVPRVQSALSELQPLPTGWSANRRSTLSLGLLGLLCTAASPSVAAVPNYPEAEANFQSLGGSRAFAVLFDDSAALAPTVEAKSNEALISDLASMRAVFLGEHHDSSADHRLQAALIRSLRAARPDGQIAVGLEAVQRKFQPALDDYLAGRIDETELQVRTEWQKRWFWPFDRYLPVFTLCRELGIRLLALNVDSEDLAAVERGGYPELGMGRLTQYVTDGAGFASFASTTAFKEYVAYIVRPSYAMHERMGILKTTITGQTLPENMSFRNFLSGRVLWDEAMAAASASWVNENPKGQLIALIGGDHVKFGCGVPARCARQIRGDNGLNSVRTLMLNPRVADTVADPTLVSRTTAESGNWLSEYTLQLRYTATGAPPAVTAGATPAVGDRDSASANSQVRDRSAVLALADYLLFSK